MKKFRNREEAGRLLGEELRQYAGRSDVQVLALPRGGVPVGYEVARALDAPLDVYVVRKLGVPGQPELAMGAIASGGVRVLNDEVVDMLGISPRAIEAVALREEEELQRRERLYRGERPAPEPGGRVVILVDDGVATGSTMRAAVKALRQRRASRIIVAVPVGAPETCRALAKEADEVVCAMMPEWFSAVGLWYEDFAQTSDEEVRELLERAASRHPAASR